MGVLGGLPRIEVPRYLGTAAGSLKALVDFFESMAKLRMHTEAGDVFFTPQMVLVMTNISMVV